MHFLIYSITFVAYKPKERSCISMARPIKETPILFGEDARRFEERMKEKRSETPEQREKRLKDYELAKRSYEKSVIY